MYPRIKTVKLLEPAFTSLSFGPLFFCVSEVDKDDHNMTLTDTSRCHVSVAMAIRSDIG